MSRQKAIRSAHTFPSGSVYIKKGKGRGRLRAKAYLKNAAILTEQACHAVLRCRYVLPDDISGSIGAEGMGLYQLIWLIFGSTAVTTTAGLSVAATRLSAELLATDDLR